MSDVSPISSSSTDIPEPVAGTERNGEPSPHPGPIRVWWLAVRPKTLWAAFVPVVVGTAIALDEGAVHWPAALLALTGALAIQIGTNLFNDYADFHRGADTPDRKGPTRVTQSGLLSPASVLAGTAGAFGTALAAGVYLIARGGIPILVVGILSILSGILYTAGPKPLAYIGLGDLFVLLFFGPVAVAGTHFVQSLELSWTAVVAGLGPGLLAVALLSINNLRDIDEDLRAGKHTLAVRFGPRFARWEYIASITGAALVPVALFILTGTHPWAMMAGGTLVLGTPQFRRILGGIEGVELNPLLGFTGRLSVIYSFVFALTWLI